MKLVILVLISAFPVNALMAQILFQKYFPLQSGAVQQYFVSHIIDGDTITDQVDNKVCRFEIVKGKKIFYLSNIKKENRSGTFIIGSESFASGGFYYQDGNFMFTPIFWKYELKKSGPSRFKLLFPKLIFIDSVYSYNDGDELRTFTFKGFETLAVKKKIMDSCLKLIVEQKWPENKYVDTVWFKKNTGVVKWLRSTGRLEEIKQ